MRSAALKSSIFVLSTESEFKSQYYAEKKLYTGRQRTTCC